MVALHRPTEPVEAPQDQRGVGARPGEVLIECGLDEGGFRSSPSLHRVPVHAIGGGWVYVRLQAHTSTMDGSGHSGGSSHFRLLSTPVGCRGLGATHRGLNPSR